ncbi:MAG: hypothetical protein ACO1OB_30655 [Archangium sp.]
MSERKRSRSWVWLVVAALLLIAGAWLMRGAEPPERPPPPPVTIPKRMTQVERERAEQRKEDAVLTAKDAGLPIDSRDVRDPVLALMPEKIESQAVVAEVNAIINSDLGPALIDCLFEPEFLEQGRDAGFDLTKNLDRVAVIDDAFVLSGQFGDVWSRAFPDAVGRDYGRRGRIIPVEGQRQMFIATWNDQITVMSRSEQEAMALLDRLDGSGPRIAQPVLNDSMAYGEVYGVFAAEALASLVQDEQAQLADTIRQTAKNARLHMDVSHDVGLSADIEANDPKQADELRRTLGGALSLARMRAQAKGEKEAADILDLARVRGTQEGSGSFQLEAGLPYEFMKTTFENCAKERRTRKEARKAKQDAAPPVTQP